MNSRCCLGIAANASRLTPGGGPVPFWLIPACAVCGGRMGRDGPAALVGSVGRGVEAAAGVEIIPSGPGVE